MIITIHQPEHVPWLGFFDKVARVDLFVVLDTVQFRKDYYQNRNRIRTPTGWTWITVPVRRPRRVAIADVEIDVDSPFRARYANLVREHYGATAYFERFFPFVREVTRSTERHLSHLNLRLLEFLFGELNVRTPHVLASELALPPVTGGSNVNLTICRQVGAQAYLAGMSGRDYLDISAFAASGIDVMFHEFEHPVYQQPHSPFLPCMSALDLLFNHGPASPAIFRGTGVATIKPFGPQQ